MQNSVLITFSDVVLSRVDALAAKNAGNGKQKLRQLTKTEMNRADYLIKHKGKRKGAEYISGLDRKIKKRISRTQTIRELVEIGLKHAGG
jgi:predicted nucleic-acid-binding protein